MRHHRSAGSFAALGFLVPLVVFVLVMLLSVVAAGRLAG